MKICMLCTNFPPDIGGIAAHVYELSRALVKLDNDVQVITLRRGFHDNKYQEIDGIKVYRVYYPRLTVIGFFIYLLYVWPKLKRLIRKGDIDIIHAHTILNDALTAKSIGKITKIQTEHSSDFLAAMEKGEHRRLYRWLLSHADHVIGTSQELVDTVIKLGIGQDKTSFISNGIDIERFNPRVEGGEIREKHKIKTEEKIILCPRRLDLKNGVYYLIKAIPYIIQQSSNVKCLIVGDGLEMAELKQEVIKLVITDKVIFAGRVPNSDMPKYYAASDVVILPSLKEATSIAGLEAMATGKSLVGTNVGGIPQIITHDKTGMLVSPRNPEELAQAIVSLLNDDGKRAAMGLNARKRAVSEFSWQIIAGKTQNIYDKVSHSKRAVSAQGRK
ncbi:glycosyltransferase family 4 protein [Chloroflexota bacterium]